MKETLQEVVKYAGGIGTFSSVKISGDEKNNVCVETFDDKDKTVVLKGYLHEPLKELENTSFEFGLSYLDILKGLLDFPNFNTENAQIYFTFRSDEDGNKNPDEIRFVDEQGQEAAFRLLDVRNIPKQPSFKGANWDIVKDFEPSSSKLKEFKHFANLYSSFQDTFSVSNIDGELRFNIGDEDSSSHRAFVKMTDGIETKVKTPIHWPTSQVLSVLKIGQNAKTSISISSKGMMLIRIISYYGNWDYYIPAKKKT